MGGEGGLRNQALTRLVGAAAGIFALSLLLWGVVLTGAPTLHVPIPGEPECRLDSESACASPKGPGAGGAMHRFAVPVTAAHPNGDRARPGNHGEAQVAGR